MNMQFPVLTARLTLLIGVLGWSASAIGQGTGGSNDAMLLLLEQNRNLQSEVQALRALVEEQGYEIRKLQRESLDRYTDTDNRLRSLEQSLANGGAVSTPPPGTDFPTPASSSGVSAPTTSASEPPIVSSTGIPTSPSRGIVDSSPTSPSPSSSVGSRPASPAQTAGTSAGPRTTTTRPSLEPAVLTEQQLYQMAYDSAINSQFERAIAEFDQYLSIYPQGRFTTNSHYWKGQAYMYLTRYDEAIAEYSIILQQYPNDAKVPDSMYGQALAYQGLGDVEQARQLLQQIVRDYPNTGAANLADTRLRSLN